jgi:hypothetical protein
MQRRHHEPGEHVSERPEPRRQPKTGIKKSWTEPRVEDLPRLENLTLQTSVGPPIDPGGSIFP